MNSLWKKMRNGYDFPLFLMACSKMDANKSFLKMKSWHSIRATVQKAPLSKGNRDNETIAVVRGLSKFSIWETIRYTTLNSQRQQFVCSGTNWVHLLFLSSAEVKEKTLFIDLSSKISAEWKWDGNSRIGFHPEFEQMGLFFCELALRGRNVIARIWRPDRTLEVKMETESIVLTFPHVC